jgi:hypothetical protein
MVAMPNAAHKSTDGCNRPCIETARAIYKQILNIRELPNAARMAHCVTQEAEEKGDCHELRSFDHLNLAGRAEQVILTTDELIA